MAKKFDVYLRDRLKQCDIIVYSLPYREGLTATNRVVVQACLSNYQLQKFVAAQFGVEVDAHIDKMIKTCHEMLASAAVVDASAGLSTGYAVKAEEAITVVSVGVPALHAEMFLEGHSSVVCAAGDLSLDAHGSLGRMSSAIVASHHTDGILKRSLEKFEAGAAVLATMATPHKQGFMEASADVEVGANLSQLCYELHAAGESAVELAAWLADLDTHYSLGRVHSAVAVAVEDARSDVEKYEKLAHELVVVDELAETVTSYMEAKPNVIEVAATVGDMLQRRYRLLDELDDMSLEELDSLPLDELDYVEI